MSLDILPNELIEQIAINLNYIDLCHLLQVNKRFNSYLCNFNGLWHHLFYKKWPALYEECYQDKENKTEINWRFEAMQCHLIGVNVYKQLSQMSARYYQTVELSENCFDCFRGLVVDNRRLCVTEELEAIVNSYDKKKHNLTIKFYAEKALRSLRTEYIRQKWTEMVQELSYSRIERIEEPVNLKQPKPQDVPGDLITGSVLVAQYCQPNISLSESKIRQKIRNIALQTVTIIKEKYPNNHLITQRHGKLLTTTEASQLTESILESKQCIEVIQALNVAMYEGSNPFRGNRDDYYLATNSYIDKVLELRVAIPITLCILYQATAALLGVKLFPINNPGHFMLAIRDKPHFPNVLQQFSFIDPFNDGKLSDQPISIIPHSVPSRQISVATPLNVFIRMASNLIEVGRRERSTSEGKKIMRNGLELGTLIYEEDVQMKLSLAQVYLSLDINHEQILQMLTHLEPHIGVITNLRQQVNLQMTQKIPPVEVKHRGDLTELQFAVGMVMRHRKYRYTCVIYGWDEKCSESTEWMERMGVKRLPKGEKQPFYKVLVDDGSTRYAAQENLAIEWKINPVFHSEVGRYFTGYVGISYELNDEIRAEYPDDEGARDGIFLTHWKKV